MLHNGCAAPENASLWLSRFECKPPAIMLRLPGLLVQNIMDEWLTCQGKWLYLEPIFSADEIMKQIPREGSAFRLMDASWRQMVQQVRWQPGPQACWAIGYTRLACVVCPKTCSMDGSQDSS